MVSLTSKLLAFAYVLTHLCMLVTAASPNAGEEPAYGVMAWQRPWIPSWWEGFEERGTWYQCKHIRLPGNEIHDKGGEPGGEHTGNLDARAGGRAYTGWLPDIVSSPDLLDTMRCEPPPSRKFNEAHCGMVYYVAHDFCDTYANLSETHIDGKDTQTVKIGPVTYDHHWYTPGMYGEMDHSGINRNSEQATALALLNYYHSNQDDFNITVTSVDGCDPHGEFDVLTPYTDWRDWQCWELLFATWAGCDRLKGNKGRGGSIQAGCLRYEVKTIRTDDDGTYIW